LLKPLYESGGPRRRKRTEPTGFSLWAAAMFAKLERALASARHTIELWRERSEQRRHLAQLNARNLKDIEITRTEAEIEANKPFWRP
jgi:uncharacterized protein YjiS (DUF1127 family)